VDVVIRGIERADVSAAVLVALGGAATARHEDPHDVDAYWAAVEETREQRGDVLVAELDGDVVGLCQVLVFRHFQHVGAHRFYERQGFVPSHQGFKKYLGS
jgi:GNAT superfamily N-acetyltransferase